MWAKAQKSWSSEIGKLVELKILEPEGIKCDVAMTIENLTAPEMIQHRKTRKTLNLIKNWRIGEGLAAAEDIQHRKKRKERIKLRIDK